MKLNLLLKIGVITSFLILLSYSFIKIPKVTFGFTGYYTFSKILLNGEELGRAYDGRYFNEKIKEYGIKDIYELYNIIPTSAYVFLPLAWLEPEQAKIIWGIISLILLISSYFTLFKVFEIKFLDNSGLLFSIIIFLWHPVYENLAFGQIYILLLFLFSIGLYGVKKNKNFLTSIPISLNILFKGYGALLIIWLFITKRYRALLLSLAPIVLIILLSAHFINIETWRAFINETFTNLGRFNEDSVVAYQNINGFVRHLLVYDKAWNPNSIAHIQSNVVFVIVIILNLSIVIVFFNKIYRTMQNIESNLLGFSAMIALSVITAPMAEEYHYALFIPLVIGLGKNIFKDISLQNNFIFILKKNLKITNVLYILSVILILLPIHFKSLQLSAFPVYLLAYPKLYGGLILLGIYEWRNN